MTTHQSNYNIFCIVGTDIMSPQAHQYWGADLIRAVLAILYQVLHIFYGVFWVTRSVTDQMLSWAWEFLIPFFSLKSYTDFSINPSSPVLKFTKIKIISLNIILNGKGVHSQFCGEVHNRTETITSKIYSRLENDMLTALFLSTGGSLNRILEYY